MEADKIKNAINCHLGMKVCANHCDYCDGTGDNEGCVNELLKDVMALLGEYERQMSGLSSALGQQLCINEFLNSEKNKYMKAMEDSISEHKPNGVEPLNEFYFKSGFEQGLRTALEIIKR